MDRARVDQVGLTTDRARALAAAERCGLSRLADITGLDRIGVPVFQAIRPRSRALAVHQGKGLTPLAAQLGALMEAVESAHAEGFEDRSSVMAYADLPPAERPPSLGDFAQHREAVPAASEALAWTLAERLIDGAPLQVPSDCVSLDCVRPWDRRLDHSSIGLGARFDIEGARMKGLLEVIERDAIAVSRRVPSALRAARGVRPGSVPYPWFQEVMARLRSAGIHVWFGPMPTVVSLPAMHAELFEAGSARGPWASGGWACAQSWEDALRGALLEALQCRLTVIAGSRDDVPHGLTGGWDTGPLPPGVDGADWMALEAKGWAPGATGSRQVADRLASVGYPDAAAVTLSSPGSDVCVVKVFVPGLAANSRARRPAARRWPA